MANVFLKTEICGSVWDVRVGFMIAVSQAWAIFCQLIKSKLHCLKMITGNIFFSGFYWFYKQLIAQRIRNAFKPFKERFLQ